MPTAVVPIDQLPAAASLTGEEIIPLLQGGKVSQTPLSKLPSNGPFDPTESYTAGTLFAHVGAAVVRPTDYPWLAKWDGTSDDVAAINSCCAWAAENSAYVELPRGVTCISAPILYGSQNTAGQSSAPLGLRGHGWQTAIVALANFAGGAMVQGWSLSGVEISDFTLNGSGVAAEYMDLAWKAGAGPSTQNTFKNLRGINPLASTAGPLFNFNDNNDAVIKKISANGGQASTIGISAIGSGGLMSLDWCICDTGYIKFGCQNGVIVNSWSKGIEWAAGSLNDVALIGGYIYANTSTGYCMWSESYASSASIKSFASIATQYICRDSSTAFFDLNLYSSFSVDGSYFTCSDGDPPSIPIFGPNTRSDSYAAVMARFRGGHAGSTYTFNDVGGVYSVCDGVMNDATGVHVQKDYAGTAAMSVAGGTTAGTVTYANRTCSWIRTGDIVTGTIKLTWSAATGTGPLTVTGLPFSASAICSATLGYCGTTFGANPVVAEIAGTSIIFWNQAAAVAVPASGDLLISFTYQTAA